MLIVAATGLHTPKYYDAVPWTDTESPELLADRFIADIESGIDRHDYLGTTVDRTEHRAGVVKVAAPAEELTARDQRLFEAAAMTSSATGVPILTHTESGKGGLQQVEMLQRLGVSPERVALSHTDKVDEPAYHRELLSTGVFLCYDQALRWQGENHTARLIVSMVDAGFGKQLLLGTDGARRTLWSTLGGNPGLAWLHTGLVDRLRAEGVGSEQIDALFEANPARFLTITSPDRSATSHRARAGQR